MKCFLLKTNEIGCGYSVRLQHMIEELALVDDGPSQRMELRTLPEVDLDETDQERRWGQVHVEG